ncbi:MAG: phage holin family protein [Bdellovibrionota bacterium]
MEQNTLESRFSLSWKHVLDELAEASRGVLNSEIRLAAMGARRERHQVFMRLLILGFLVLCVHAGFLSLFFLVVIGVAWIFNGNLIGGMALVGGFSLIGGILGLKFIGSIYGRGVRFVPRFMGNFMGNVTANIRKTQSGEYYERRHRKS